MIEKAAGKLSVNRACKLMKVRRQGYYEYLSRKDNTRKTEDRQLTAKIKNIFYESNPSMARGKSGRSCAKAAMQSAGSGFAG